MKDIDDTLLQELNNKAGSNIEIEDDLLIIKHMYIENKMTPLNMYLETANKKQQNHIINDYGKAIDELINSNIFPGDMLTKNFGVTRHGRVIFYDYDELCLVTDCNFRDMPEASFGEDEMRPDNWFYVGEDDVFPAEFIKFLSMDKSLKDLFHEVHGDLLTAEYWREIKRQHFENQILEVVPYYRQTPRSVPN